MCKIVKNSPKWLPIGLFSRIVWIWGIWIKIISNQLYFQNKSRLAAITAYSYTVNIGTYGKKEYVVRYQIYTENDHISKFYF